MSIIIFVSFAEAVITIVLLTKKDLVIPMVEKDVSSQRETIMDDQPGFGRDAVVGFSLNKRKGPPLVSWEDILDELGLKVSCPCGLHPNIESCPDCLAFEQDLIDNPINPWDLFPDNPS